MYCREEATFFTVQDDFSCTVGRDGGVGCGSSNVPNAPINSCRVVGESEGQCD